MVSTAWLLLISVCVATSTLIPLSGGRSLGSEPSIRLSEHEKLDFFSGKALFEKVWTNSLSIDSSNESISLSNPRTCSSCHEDGGRSNSFVHADSRFQSEGKSRVRISSVIYTYADGDTVHLHRPHIEVNHSLSVPYKKARSVDFAPRVSPSLWALSAMEAIPERQIIAWSDPGDANRDGISGRVRWVFSLHAGERRLGRFGWKATAPTLEDQIANAFATDMGLSNRLIKTKDDNCATLNRGCFSATSYEDTPLERYAIRDELFSLVVAYNRGLATPSFNGSSALFSEGIVIFDELGCNACHKYAYDKSISSQTKMSIETPPFTDMLLHDMGMELADTRRQGSITAAEWRTAPLRGLAYINRSNPKAGYLHDGRALTIEQAIMWHGGEAAISRELFSSAPRSVRKTLLDFLGNL